jgi:hypothetical protein
VTSPVPLAGKLGIRAGHTVLLLGDFDLGELPPDVRVARRRRPGQTYDVIVVCCRDAAVMHRRVPALITGLAVAGGLWIGWPKKASGVATDLSDWTVRDFGLSTGLVDVKVAALDGTWSGLRFVRRATDRTPPPDRP